jgi:lysophospholipase L1-like esterase
MWSQVRAVSGAASVVAAVLLLTSCHVSGSAAVATPPAATGSAAATASAGSASSAAAASGAAGPIVALGDSYTAGGLLPLDPTASPTGCLRSTKAYPFLVASALHAQLTDVACTNAGVNMMTSPQKTYLGTNPPQLNALGPQDKLVLLSLGGDDMGFLNVIQECMLLAAFPSGSPCEQRYTVTSKTGASTNALASSVTVEKPKIAQLLAEIRQRAPQARIVLVGYPDLFPQSGGCWPAVPITNGDVAYLRGIEVKINAMLSADAAAAGDTFVNTYTPTVGHDFCQPEKNRDVEGLLPGSLALPFHPNAKGQQAMATAVLSALRS